MLAEPSRATGQAGYYLRSRSRAGLTRALTLAAGESRVLVTGQRAVIWSLDRQTTCLGLPVGGRPLYSLLSRSLAGRTEALTHASAGCPSQIDFSLGCRLARGPGIRANDHRVQQAVGRGSPWPGALGHCKVPAGRLPQAAGMELVTVHQERLPAKQMP